MTARIRFHPDAPQDLVEAASARAMKLTDDWTISVQFGWRGWEVVVKRVPTSLSRGAVRRR